MGLPIEEGQYKDRNGKIYSLINLEDHGNDFITFELVESEDPDDMSAISVELSNSDWDDFCHINGITAL